MTDDQPSPNVAGDEQRAEEGFYAAALLRIRSFMLVLGPALCAGAWVKFARWACTRSVISRAKQMTPA